MTAAPLHLAGERLLLDPDGVLFWPAMRLLAVADLHLEKGSAAARQGQLVPPWDSRITLERLARLVRRWRPERVVALGDSFHDTGGADRLPRAEADRLRALTHEVPFTWVLGNHDPAPPAGFPGEATAELRLGPLRFRHQAATATLSGGGEVAGHHHPKARVETRAGPVSRPCFVADPRRLILPAFGAYTGGLDVRDRAIARLFPRGGRVFLLGRERLFSFALGGPAGEATRPGMPALEPG